MRRGPGFIRCIEPSFALLALAACSSAPRGSVAQQVTNVSCGPAEMRERTGDRAVLAFRTPVSAGDCVPRTVAAMLRPWLDGPLEPWTVTVAQLVTSDTVLGVSVMRLRADRARDALDEESVFVQTDDLELVEYASARHDLSVAALPWDRLYLRVGIAADDTLGMVDPAAVRAEARPATPLSQCERFPASRETSHMARSRRAVYLRGDATGRELAERIVGLGNAREVVGVDSAAFEAALRAGHDGSFIISVPVKGNACAAVGDLLRRVPWAGRASIEALLETRAYTITRRATEP